VLFFFAFGCASAGAQSTESPQAQFEKEPLSALASMPSVESSQWSRAHPFWDKSNLGLHGANLLAQGLDYWSTRRLIERGHQEMNPIVRPFSSTDAGMAAYSFGLSFGGTLAASYLLHRTGSSLG
jgi:hypothetical protein